MYWREYLRQDHQFRAAKADKRSRVKDIIGQVSERKERRRSDVHPPPPSSPLRSCVAESAHFSPLSCSVALLYYSVTLLQFISGRQPKARPEQTIRPEAALFSFQSHSLSSARSSRLFRNKIRELKCFFCYQHNFMYLFNCCLVANWVMWYSA